LVHCVSGKRGEEVELRGSRWWGGGGVGEDGLIKHHVSRNEDPTRGKVEAAVPLMIRGVPEEDTLSRARSELVGGGGSDVRVARTPEDSEVVIATRGTEESVVWSGSWAGNRR
jgi:hypothetical protein